MEGIVLFFFFLFGELCGGWVMFLLVLGEGTERCICCVFTVVVFWFWCMSSCDFTDVQLWFVMGCEVLC